MPTRKNHKNNPKNRSGKKNKKNRKRNDQIKLRGGAAAAEKARLEEEAAAAATKASTVLSPIHPSLTGDDSGITIETPKHKGISKGQTKARQTAKTLKKTTEAGTAKLLGRVAATGRRGPSSGAVEPSPPPSPTTPPHPSPSAAPIKAEEEEKAENPAVANGVTASVVIVIPVDGDKGMSGDLSDYDFQCANVDESGSITLIGRDEAGKPQYYYKQIDINNAKIGYLIETIRGLSNSEVAGESPPEDLLDLEAAPQPMSSE